MGITVESLSIVTQWRVQGRQLQPRSVTLDHTKTMTKNADKLVNPDDSTATNRQLVAGWQGRYFKDFEVGAVYKHPYGHTVTETDNVWMTNLTMNLNPMHFNEPYVSETGFGERLVDGTFVFALAVGMSVINISANTTANFGYDKVRHHNPVFHGNTIFAESEVLEKRESEIRDHVGIVTTELRAYNQNDDLVLSLERTPMVLKREAAQPSAAFPTGWPDEIGTQPEDLE